MFVRKDPQGTRIDTSAQQCHCTCPTKLLDTEYRLHPQPQVRQCAAGQPIYVHRVRSPLRRPKQACPKQVGMDSQTTFGVYLCQKRFCDVKKTCRFLFLFFFFRSLPPFMEKREIVEFHSSFWFSFQPRCVYHMKTKVIRRLNCFVLSCLFCFQDVHTRGGTFI